MLYNLLLWVDVQNEFDYIFIFLIVIDEYEPTLTLDISHG
jgi:hypothetical protein